MTVSSVSRHRRPWSVGRVAVVAAAAAVLVGAAAVAAAGWGRGDCDGPDATLTVAVAPDHHPVVSELAEEWNAGRPSVDGHCVRAVVEVMPSSFVASTLSPAWDRERYGTPPDVWLPESSVWVRVARSGSATALLPPAPPSLAASPVVLAMQRGMAEALGWPERELGWADLVEEFGRGGTWDRYGHPEWGPLRLALPDPTRSTAGIAAVLSVLDSDGDQAASDDELLAAVALSRLVTEVPNEGEALLRRYEEAADPVAADLPAAFPVLERDLARHPPRGVELVPVYPSEGVMVADHPAVSLNAPWVDATRRRAAEEFLAYLTGPEGRQAYVDAGFRDPTNSVPRGLSLPRSRGFRLELPAVLAAAPTAADLLATWDSLHAPHRVLVLLDTSGSMEDPVPGTELTRLELLQHAALEGISRLPDRTWVGLWEFSTELTPTAPYRELVPVGPAAAPLPDGTVRREAMAEAIADLRADGGTGLYDTVHDAYRLMREGWQPEAQNLLVVVTDGRDEYHPGRSLAELLTDLADMVRPDRPLPVIALAIGPEADVDALEAIVEVTGGRVIVARDDPSAVEQIALAFVGRL